MDDWSPLLDDKAANARSFGDPLDSGPRGEESTCPKCKGRALRQEMDFPAACLRQTRWLCKHGCPATVESEERDPPKKAPVKLILAPRPKPRPGPVPAATDAMAELRAQAAALIKATMGPLSVAEIARRCEISVGLIYKVLSGKTKLRRPNTKRIIAALSGIERKPEMPVISPELVEKFNSLPKGIKSAAIAKKTGLPVGSISGIFSGAQASSDRLDRIAKALDEVIEEQASMPVDPDEVKTVRIDEVAEQPKAASVQRAVFDGSDWQPMPDEQISPEAQAVVDAVTPDVFDLARELAMASKRVAEVKRRMHELPGGAVLAKAVCEMEAAQL